MGRVGVGRERVAACWPGQVMEVHVWGFGSCATSMHELVVVVVSVIIVYRTHSLTADQAAPVQPMQLADVSLTQRTRLQGTFLCLRM